MNDTQTTLEFDKIKQQLAEHACSQAAKRHLLALAPSLRESECHQRMQQTTAAKKFLKYAARHRYRP